MRKLKVGIIWIPAFLLAAALVGCSDSDKNPSAGNPGGQLTPPTVISVTPAGGSSVACQGTLVTATFSKPMNRNTIDSPATTFTLTGPSGSVDGTVSMDAANLVATFTPTNPLVLDTPYTATITTNAQDQFGNGLVNSSGQPADFVWMFRTRPTACPVPIAIVPELCGIGILAGSAITNSSGASVVNGDVDIFPGSAINGFPPGIINGTRHTTDGIAAAAQNRLDTAYTTASTLPQGTSLKPDIGGSTLQPGVYTTVAQPSLGITGDLTLDPVGDPNAVWIFQIASTLTTAGGNVTVLPPGKNGNVFWAIGSAATLGANTTMAGNLMAQAAITMNGGNTLNGRALARRAGAVTISTTTINVPSPCP